ncbi:hypothetical protein F2Q68_00025123 [Brassica cretica]|uniref:Zinc finger GRF-type domain-containing protein n=1 Tax=Brassica cretica TaxID=69181 RepID=A0A8S9I8X6_BRACR|nr:hypothetical protein F2Q68_00025123 [Brassica cretica]
MIRVQATCQSPIGHAFSDRPGRNTGSACFNSFSLITEKARVCSERGAISLAMPTSGDFLHQIDDIASLPRAQVNGSRRREKREKEATGVHQHAWLCGRFTVNHSQYEIPTRCLCGGGIINEVRGKEDYDTLPGKRFFTCKNYEDDGLHYRQPWVIGVQEEISWLTKRVEETEKVIKGVPNLNKKIEELEEEVKNLTVQVADLERLCFE